MLYRGSVFGQRGQIIKYARSVITLFVCRFEEKMTKLEAYL